MSTWVLDKAVGRRALYSAHDLAVIVSVGQFSEAKVNHLTLTVLARLVGRIAVSTGQCMVIKVMYAAMIGLVTTSVILYAFGGLGEGMHCSKTVGL